MPIWRAEAASQAVLWQPAPIAGGGLGNMLGIRSARRKAKHSDDLNRLLAAIEAAGYDTRLLALNMALESVRAGSGSAAQLADAVGELSIRATQFSYRVRGCMLRRGTKLDSGTQAQLQRITWGVAELIEEVSGLAVDLADGIADPVIERLPEVAPNLLDQVRARTHALDLLLDDLPDVARGSRS